MTVITDDYPGPGAITGYSTREERLAARPANYNELSPLHRWQIDDELGLFEEEEPKKHGHKHHKHHHKHHHKE